jgi:hypothetical protein
MTIAIIGPVLAIGISQNPSNVYCPAAKISKKSGLFESQSYTRSILSCVAFSLKICGTTKTVIIVKVYFLFKSVAIPSALELTSANTSAKFL